eukprot:scaffold38696_cov16-Tisochrysis_lutea.AAC.1
METERTIGQVKQVKGDHTSNMTEERTFLALHTVQDQLHLFGSNWAEWRKQAAQQAAARRNSPRSNYPALVQAALQKQQQRGAKRPRGSRATDEAGRAAQRRQHDPAAVRVRLVHDMRYIKLKKAALLALMQSEQQQQQEGQQQEQQQKPE